MTVVEGFYIFEDLETTGLENGIDEPIEIASILTDKHLHEVSRFHSKIQFDFKKMKPDAAAVNGFTPEIWAKEAVPYYKYEAWMQKNIPYPNVAVPIGHNVYFDREILYHFHYKPTRKFFKWSFRPIDTMGLARAMAHAGVFNPYPPDFRLETLLPLIGITYLKSHRAMSDCEGMKALYEFAVAMMKKDLVG